MRADPLRRQVGGGWTLEVETFLGSVKWHRAVRRVPFGAQKSNSEKYFGQLPDNQFVKDFIKFRYFKMTFKECPLKSTFNLIVLLSFLSV
jgi:hypothetical protein